MNERIKELAMKANEDFHYNEKGFAESFAELIVRECMLCCERVISDPVPKSVDTWLNGGLQCIDEIKQHFGVEKSRERVYPKLQPRKFPEDEE